LEYFCIELTNIEVIVQNNNKKNLFETVLFRHIAYLGRCHQHRLFMSTFKQTKLSLVTTNFKTCPVEYAGTVHSSLCFFAYLILLRFISVFHLCYVFFISLRKLICLLCIYFNRLFYLILYSVKTTVETNNTAIIIGTVLGIIIVALLVFSIYMIVQRRRGLIRNKGNTIYICIYCCFYMVINVK
jgi:hypothetical protein